MADTANNRIQVFSSDGTFISKWGTFGRIDDNFRSPEGIAVDSGLVMYMWLILLIIE